MSIFLYVLAVALYTVNVEEIFQKHSKMGKKRNCRLRKHFHTILNNNKQDDGPVEPQKSPIIAVSWSMIRLRACMASWWVTKGLKQLSNICLYFVKRSSIPGLFIHEIKITNYSLHRKVHDCIFTSSDAACWPALLFFFFTIFPPFDSLYSWCSLKALIKSSVVLGKGGKWCSSKLAHCFMNNWFTNNDTLLRELLLKHLFPSILQ